MTEHTSVDAQRRADQIRSFRAELETLRAEGLNPLGDAEAARVSAHHEVLLRRLAATHDIDRTADERQLSRGLRAATLVGAVAVVAAVVSFVHRVWGSLDTPAQVLLLTLAPVGATGAMLAAGRLERTRYVSSIFAAAACAAFVLQTIMLGTLFNLGSSPHVLAAWALFAGAVALPWRFGLPYAACVACAIGYAAAASLALAGATWTQFPERPELLFPPCALALAATFRVPVELRPWHRGTTLAILLGAVFVLGNWGAQSLLPLAPTTIEIAYQAAGVLLGMLTLMHGIRHGRGEVLAVGAAFAGIFLLARFADWWWDVLPRDVFFVLIALLAFSWIWLLRAARSRIVASRA